MIDLDVFSLFTAKCLNVETTILSCTLLINHSNGDLLSSNGRGA